MRLGTSFVRIGAWLPLLLAAWTTEGVGGISAPDSVDANIQGSFRYEWTYVVGPDTLALAGLGASNEINTQGVYHGDCFCFPLCTAQAGDTIRWVVRGRLIDPRSSGRIRNWLAGCETVGENTRTIIVPTTVAGVEPRLADGLKLWSSPNPFSERTTIFYTLPATGFVELAIYDVNGRRIATPLRRFAGAGMSSVVWDPRHTDHGALESGVYFARLEFMGRIIARRILLLP